MKRRFRTGDDRALRETASSLELERARVLIEESREIVVVLDESERVLATSRRARESLEGLVEGEQLPESARSAAGRRLLAIPYELAGKRETLLYLSEPGDLTAYEELRAGFTAAVSHELRTPLARLLVLLESMLLPGEDVPALIAQASGEVEQIRELIDDVLFLGELETGRTVVSLSHTHALPVLEETLASLSERAARADVELVLDVPETLELPLRPRMLRVVAGNLAENALRYAGEGATFTLSLRSAPDGVLLEAADDGIGVTDEDLPRLFERFYRADQARASRGTGLGLAIVKHIVVTAGGSVEAAHRPGGGLTVRCRFPLL